MLPKPGTHDSSPPPSSRSRNYEQELSSWFGKHAAPIAEMESAPPPAPADDDPEWVEEEPSTGRLPFLIY